VSARVVGGVAASVLLAACAAPQSEAEPAAGTTATATPVSETVSDTASEAAPETTTPEPTGHDPGIRVIADDSEFGTMLYGSDGQAIYLFDLEESARPRCYDECAAAWPPVLTTGELLAGAGVRPGLLGTVRRRDGSSQVTYAGHPLYFYAHEDPWQVLCHDFADFGGTWYVVQPGGTPAP
jgi:predicted lipoprotein with Yx(FWY)xxD motif